MADGIKRWMTAEGTFRILAADSRDTVGEAVELAGCAPAVADVFGRLLTGTALLQLAQSPIDRVQCAIEHTGVVGQVLADVWPGPVVRGRVEYSDPVPGPLIADPVEIRVTRQPARGGEPYQSAVPVRDGNVANALQQYVLESEQVLTMFALATVVADDGSIERSGGMIVQALPGAVTEHLQAITACLEKARWDDLVQVGDDPIGATEALFDTIKPHHVGSDPLVYRCRCSTAAAVAAVRLLSEPELADVRAGKAELVTCEFCRTTYEVAAQDLREA